MEKKIIFITGFHPLVGRNILATPLFDMLKCEGVGVVLFARAEKRDFFVREYGKENIRFEGLPDGLSGRDLFLRALALAALRTRTLDIKRKTEMRGSGAWMARIFSLFPAAGKKIVRALSEIFTPRTFWRHAFDLYHPSVVFSTDVQNERDAQMLHEAKRRRISTIGMVRSWDNLTAKGLIRSIPETLLVHNEIIAREAEILHGVARAQIRLVGIPHYDCYIRSRVSAREEFCRRIGADPTKRIVLYAPVGDRYLENNTLDPDIVHILDQNLPDGCQIVVRLPPGDTVKSFEGRTAAGRIIFDHARRGAAPMGALTKEDDAHLLDTVWWSDVVVAGPSTICIDAAVCDKPIALVGFDGYRDHPYYESVRRYYDYDHFRPIIESGGARVAKNPQELIEAIKEYIAHPELHRAGREKIVREELYFQDGNSTRRVFDALFARIKKSELKK